MIKPRIAHTSLYFVYVHTTRYVQVIATPPNDIAVVSVVPFPSEVYEGEIVNITVAVKNNGSVIETFNVTAYYNDTAITLPNGKTTQPSL